MNIFPCGGIFLGDKKSGAGKACGSLICEFCNRPWEYIKEKLNMADAPIIQAAEAVEKTIANPSPSNIVADIELAIELVKQFKANIAGLHPSVINIIKALL